MEDMIVARINGKMLTWARDRAGVAKDHLAMGSITVEKLTAWENGGEFPSQAQAIALADKLGISYAMLFMPTVPPPDVLAIPDLRTIGGHRLTHISLDFREVLNDATIRQEWFREARIEDGQSPLSLVGKFSTVDDPKIVAADMRSVLRLTNQDRSQCTDYESFIKHLVSCAESIGILVMRSAVVKHATNRPLNVSEFRGFAISDAFAPVVFINDADAKAAQIFTIVHEMVHIWIGADGVSDRTPNTKSDSRNAVEMFCDRVAAEVLVPEAEFEGVWKAESITSNAKRIAGHFRVSSLVALRRAKDLGKITVSVFTAQVDSDYARFREIDRKKRARQENKERKGGGNFWASFELRNGKKFNTSVADSLRNQKVSYSEASVLLGINIASTVRYLKRTEAR